jgi:hypothetical protein
MNYRRSNYRSHSARTITAKFLGKCFCCGGDVMPGELADYIPATRKIGHYKAASGDSSRCYSVLRKPDAGFIDLDRAYEDQCAAICGR